MRKKRIRNKALFSIDEVVLKALNSISRNDLPNKSNLVESLLRDWLIKNKHLNKED